ncbi:8-amino-7-oxononanoate synthase [Mucilaginibacter mali]|uniref:8-amino-7-oxononanoate synthase n=2 Tax=Mucilaginibacter mali TaxID=2740462 RepID=A0A7D4QYB5_9SPHI|nr:8-amino-7-oxononanoate synthase [Mucilaginibacter mali]
MDFCSNDYLGFARSAKLRDAIDQELADRPTVLNGSTGSRLLAGNTDYAEKLEAEIAGVHGYEAGLIYNSGYDTNLGLFSSLPQKGDTIITDELVHASIIDGCRLSHAERFRFKHNDINSLEDKLQRAKGNIYIAIESIYSMDGDVAPLIAIAAIAEKYKAHLIVDEAHATGVFGYGLVHQLGLQGKVFAQVVTFGKALGCHGAIVLGSNLLRDYLINFSRSFIYTTAAPFHQLASVKMAYRLLQQNDMHARLLHHHINYFKANFTNKYYRLIPSDSSIQCIIMGSNDKAKALAGLLQSGGFDVRPILSPTVAAGSERVRICIHSYNTELEIAGLLAIINTFTA